MRAHAWHIVFAGAVLVGGWASPAEAGEQRWVDYDRGLFLRSGPGRTHAIIGGIEYGEGVELLRVLPGDWGQVRRGDRSVGYARANHLIAAPPPAKPITWCWSRHLYVTADAGVNVRSGPGTDFEVLGALAYGEGVVDCKETAHGWTKVRDGLGLVGYAASAYLGTQPLALRLGAVTTGGAGAAVYRARSQEAEVVERLGAETQLDALTGDWDGFVKVRLPDTRTGFVLMSALRTTGPAPTGSGSLLVVLLAVLAAGLVLWRIMATRAVPLAAPAAAVAPVEPTRSPSPPRETIVPLAPPAPPPPLPPPPPPPPFPRPPTPGGTASEAEAAARWMAALEGDVSERIAAGHAGMSWSIQAGGLCCVTCGAVPFDLIRLRPDGDVRCFPCAWQVGWLNDDAAQLAWGPLPGPVATERPLPAQRDA